MAEWLTTPLESTSEGGNLIMATVRKNVAAFRGNPKFRYRIEVTWRYEPDEKGMPSEELSEQMEAVGETLEAVFHKDPVAVLTGIYTGDGARDLVFYSLSLHIFQRKFNEALAEFPPLPLEFSAEEDPDWEEYSQMLALAEAAEAE
ncbi:MAG: DUF695 domain-containing protein [Muribaculaceae bacterium]|nr:DUF695 domain-containing protein [Muribaculaceae bacterium]